MSYDKKENSQSLAALDSRRNLLRALDRLSLRQGCQLHSDLLRYTEARLREYQEFEKQAITAARKANKAETEKKRKLERRRKKIEEERRKEEAFD